MVQQLGQVVTDPAKFRKAGVDTSGGFVGRIFPSAANRLDLIVQTETMRAHNQGRIGFYKHAGVKKVRWLTAEDDRVCPVCGPLSEKVFAFEDAPNIPAHPACRCTVVAELDDEDVGSISTPEEYGVLGDEPLDDPATSFLPPPLDRNDPSVKFVNFSGDTGPGFLTDAGSPERQQFARSVGNSVASGLESIGIPLHVPANGVEFRFMTTRELGRGGIVGVREDRIVVAMLDHRGQLRRLVDVVGSVSEELIHYSTIKENLVAFERGRGFFIPDSKLQSALSAALRDNAQRHLMVRKVIEESNLYENDQEVELLAKILRDMSFSNVRKILMDDDLVRDIIQAVKALGYGVLP